MKYQDYVAQKEKQLNELPIFWAFSMKQFEEALNERGLTLKDTDKLYKIGNGGFYLKTDAPKIHAYFDGLKDLNELMKDYDFALGAFRYEMNNHEYAINWEGDYDVLSVFFNNLEYEEGKNGETYLREAGREDLIKPYQVAREQHYKIYG